MLTGSAAGVSVLPSYIPDSTVSGACVVCGSAAGCLQTSAPLHTLANWLRAVLLGPTRYRVTPGGGGGGIRGSKQRRTHRAAETGTFGSRVMGLRKTTTCTHCVTRTGTNALLKTTVRNNVSVLDFIVNYLLHVSAPIGGHLQVKCTQNILG
jgi:hypothetical protein